MLVGEASISPSMERMKAQHMDRTGFARGQGEVVVVRTNFPHTSGKLAAYDDWMPRAFVILRNPLHAIPCYFDQLYEMKSHMPAGSAAKNSEETLAAWIKWRDNELSNQILLYRRFVSFWMEKYLEKDDKRVYFSFESLVDEEKGPREAVRLATFLEGGIKANAMEMTRDLRPDLIGVAVAESVKTFVNIEDIPCIWRESVWKELVHTSISDGEAATGHIQEGANNLSFRGEDWSPTQRPFTPENYVAISDMILELMNRWGRHKRLLGILSGYFQEVKLALQNSLEKY